VAVESFVFFTQCKARLNPLRFARSYWIIFGQSIFSLWIIVRTEMYLDEFFLFQIATSTIPDVFLYSFIVCDIGRADNVKLMLIRYLQKTAGYTLWWKWSKCSEQ